MSRKGFKVILGESCLLIAEAFPSNKRRASEGFFFLGERLNLQRFNIFLFISRVTHVSRDIRVEGRSARTLAPRPLLIGLSDLETAGFLRLGFFFFFFFFSARPTLLQFCEFKRRSPGYLSACLQLEVSLRDPSSPIIRFLLRFGFPGPVLDLG
jgi:hypothetical protein